MQIEIFFWVNIVIQGNFPQPSEGMLLRLLMSDACWETGELPITPQSIYWPFPYKIVVFVLNHSQCQELRVLCVP